MHCLSTSSSRQGEGRPPLFPVLLLVFSALQGMILLPSTVESVPINKGTVNGTCIADHVMRSKRYMCTEPKLRAYRMAELLNLTNVMIYSHEKLIPSYTVLKRCDDECCYSVNDAVNTQKEMLQYKIYDTQKKIAKNEWLEVVHHTKCQCK